MDQHKWVYEFGGNQTEGNAEMRSLLGGKGCNLAEMAVLGLPVPSGFTVTTEVCTYYYRHEQEYPDELDSQVNAALRKLEEKMGMKFGDIENPLLVSVRSGAPISMPGMMDTVLNLGLNDETVLGLAKKSGDGRFAWDSYRRFIQMYANVVMGLEGHDFEAILEGYKEEKSLENDTDVTAEGWQDIIVQYKALVREKASSDFPQEPMAQLWGAVCAVFESWMSPRAITYRRINDISPSLGTAVNVQAMVFGNMGDDCGTGVAFTRDPSTGENVFYGEYLINAQGEDVVAGIRTPKPLDEMKAEMPETYQQLEDVRQKLEGHFRDVQDIEFTIQQGTLYMLQTRAAKRTAAAALKIAVELEKEGMISKEEALLRLDPKQLDHILHPTLDPKAKTTLITKGLPASPGAASGQIAFTADEAQEKAEQGIDVILCRTETSPEDIHGMHAAKGILTARGGMTSHAAVVARGMGKPCVCGAGSLVINPERRKIWVDGEAIDINAITIDGGTGEVLEGIIPTIDAELSDDFQTVMEWADEARRMKIRTNAETPKDAEQARQFGAEGIGLCRTEHMFFNDQRILKVREMILSYYDTERHMAALDALLPEQRKDFTELFQIMDGLPVTIRLLDPPLHEFLPHTDKDIQEFSAATGIEEKHVRRRLQEVHEFNPMLGHRGCRLGITFPQVYEMQTRAIFEAALDVKAEGISVIPEVMIPLAGTARELAILKEHILEVIEAVFEERGENISYLLGTMIELPRAALCADELAEEAEFFSFGTNDLTQTAMGISRDDSAHFMGAYIEKGIFERDPFATLDIDGVGQLVEIAVDKGRKVNSDIKLGVCGEHGGDPSSIAFFEQVGLDYVSCSPFRVPIARLAAAQATIRQKKVSSAHQKKAA